MHVCLCVYAARCYLCRERGQQPGRYPEDNDIVVVALESYVDGTVPNTKTVVFKLYNVRCVVLSMNGRDVIQLIRLYVEVYEMFEQREIETEGQNASRESIVWRLSFGRSPHFDSFLMGHLITVKLPLHPFAVPSVLVSIFAVIVTHSCSLDCLSLECVRERERERASIGRVLCGRICLRPNDI